MSLTFPDELIKEIIGHCSDFHTLNSLCLTSSLCLVFAQPLVFARPRIFNTFRHDGRSSRERKFLRSLIERPDLASAVRVTTIELVDNDQFHEQIPLDTVLATLITAAVQALNVSQSYEDQFYSLMTKSPDEAVATLKVILCTHLETLGIDGATHKMRHSLLADFARLKGQQSMPHLRHLWAKNRSDKTYIGEALVPFFNASPCLETFTGYGLGPPFRSMNLLQLEELRLFRAAGDFPTTVVRDILVSMPMLRKLTITLDSSMVDDHAEISWEVLGNTLRAHGLSLRCFELTLWGDDFQWYLYDHTSSMPMGDLTSLTHLTDLVVPAEALTGPKDYDGDAELLVGMLPRSLVHLALDPCDEWENMQLSPAIDALTEERNMKCHHKRDRSDIYLSGLNVLDLLAQRVFRDKMPKKCHEMGDDASEEDALNGDALEKDDLEEDASEEDDVDETWLEDSYEEEDYEDFVEDEFVEEDYPEEDDSDEEYRDEN